MTLLWREAMYIMKEKSLLTINVFFFIKQSSLKIEGQLSKTKEVHISSLINFSMILKYHHVFCIHGKNSFFSVLIPDQSHCR